MRAARTRNPCPSRWARMLPAAAAATASGLMMASVSMKGVMGSGLSVKALEARTQQRHDVRGTLHHGDSRVVEGLHLVGGGGAGARDDRAGVAHAATGRCRLTRDEADH